MPVAEKKKPARQGRPTIAGQKCKPIGVCMTPDLIEKLGALGGSRWARFVIETADVERDGFKQRPKRWCPDVYVKRQCLTMPPDLAAKLKLLGGSPWLRQRVVDADIEEDGI